ncbi:hypothetical protein HOC35_00015 [Candidatus Woesearchaeota archaeon]|jgi:hypothetical protein|nr:hypothetical protein [Candidatus Woesearchaeota archaeon]
MATPISDLGIIEPALESIKQMFGTLSYFIGGVFGVYVLLFIWRIIDTRLTNKMLSKMLQEQKKTNHLLRRIEHTMELKARKR